MKLPKKLQKGDTIGIIAPSDPIEKEDLETINQSITLMEASGFSVVFGKHVFSNSLGYSEAAEKKAEDINQMFQDPTVKAIFSASGGFNSNSTFDYLDYELISQHPKILCGFSDTTSIANVISQKADIVTFSGATFKALTSWATEYGYQQVMRRFVEGSLHLAEEDDDFITIQEGNRVAEGKLIGGNLSLMAGLSSGTYQVDFNHKILFLEELCLESPPAMVSHYLYQMKQNGVFDHISGLWLGNYDGSVSLEKIVLDTIGTEIKFPIIKSNHFGHTEKKMVIPIGTKARIDTQEEKKITLIEPCVV